MVLATNHLAATELPSEPYLSVSDPVPLRLLRPPAPFEFIPLVATGPADPPKKAEIETLMEDLEEEHADELSPFAGPLQALADVLPEVAENPSLASPDSRHLDHAMESGPEMPPSVEGAPLPPEAEAPVRPEQTPLVPHLAPESVRLEDLLPYFPSSPPRSRASYRQE